MSKELETIAREWYAVHRHFGTDPQMLAAFAKYVLSQQPPSVIDAERMGVGEYVVRFGSQPPAGQVIEAGDAMASMLDAGIPSQRKAIYAWTNAIREYRSLASAPRTNEGAEPCADS
jgi:hypothetical protein